MTDLAQRVQDELIQAIEKDQTGSAHPPRKWHCAYVRRLRIPTFNIACLVR